MTKLGVFKESNNLGAILSMDPAERPLLFYAEDTHTYVQYEGYVRELLSRGFPVVYVTSDPSDPVLEMEADGLSAYAIQRQLPNLMKKIDSTLVVMTMPDLGRFHVPRPGQARVLYVFHSLNSAHTSYRTGAFDDYDVFGCTGPHHVAEIAEIRRQRGAPPADLEEVGYYKLDRIANDHAGFVRSPRTQPKVLIAPSWGPGNLLEAHGEGLVDSLLGVGLAVIVRPHPQFFHSLYPQGEAIVRKLEERYKKVDAVEFELSIDTEDSFHDSDLMICDWSGAAPEYALGTLRPVLFIDSPQKLFNPRWEEVALPAFEYHVRSQIGAILSSEDVSRAGQSATKLIERSGEYRDALLSLRSQAVFNFGRSAQAFADLVEVLLETGTA